MKKLLALLLCLVMMLSATLAVAESIVTPAGELPIVTQPVTLRVAIPVDAKVESIKETKLTKWLEEKTGITLEFIELSPTDVDTQINMIMNSGDLPDIFLGYNFPYDAFISYVDAGYILAVDDLVEKYASEDGYKRFLREFPADNIEAYAKIDDGMYAVVAGGAMITNIYASNGIRLQSEFLDKFGMDDPQTLDDLYNYLVAVRDKDPNGNGINDEVPLTTHISGHWHHNLCRTIGSAFQYTEPSNYLKLNNGTVEFVANNEKFKQTVEYLKKLVDEKLLEPAAFTQDSTTLASRQPGDEAIFGAYAVGNASDFIDTSSQQYLSIIWCPPLEGPDGYRATVMNLPSVNRTRVITTACEHPDVAFRFCDFLLTEEASVAFRIGFEGSEWEKADEGELGRNGEQAKYKLLKPQEWIQPTTNVIWNNENVTFANAMNFVYEKPGSPTALAATNMIRAGFQNHVTNEGLPQLLMSIEDSQEYTELQGLIVGYINENVALFALGDKSMDEWDSYVGELEKMGVGRYVELAQQAYDALNK